MKFESVFKKGSKTFFGSSKLFPQKIRAEVTILYAFVRTADDFVDQIKQDKRGFITFKNDYLSDSSKHPVVVAFKKLEEAYGFKKEWTRAFLGAMEQDLHKKSYATIAETEAYVYGSANVIGLYLAKLMKLPERANVSAELLGKSFQFVNFIRDIAEDIRLGRNYFPQDELKKIGLEDLDYYKHRGQSEKIAEFIRLQIKRYYAWQGEAEKGFELIPRNYLIPIKTASDLYKWTANQVYRQPLIVFEKKIKPSRVRIWLTGIKNMITTR